ncbi:MAG: 6-phospho-3-hexuloisomerase [Candidatus Micrarchaeota archaeon]
MTLHAKMEKLLAQIGERCRDVDRKQGESFLGALVGAKRIFVCGAGRSGLVARSFAMRLMHLGMQVYVVGETTTPAVEKGDLFVCISGSGRTTSIVAIAKVAKDKGVSVAAITSHLDSPIGTLADCAVRIKGRKVEEEKEKRDYNARQLTGEHEPVSPLGTIFELSSMMFLDSVISELMERINRSEEHMKKLHNNLE